MGSKEAIEEIRYLSTPEELLRLLKNMRIHSKFEIVWDRNVYGDFESASFVRKSEEPNEWLLQETINDDFEQMTTEELVTEIILRLFCCNDLCLFQNGVLYCLIGPEWDEVILRSIKHEIHSYVKFMDRNPIYYQEEYVEEE